MSHRINKFLIVVIIIAVAVGSVVYWEWPATSRRQRSETNPTSTVDLLRRATTSILESLPRPTVGPPPAAAAPTITWTPGAVNEVIGQGQIKTISVSFTASENLSNISVRVVPELQPFVQTTPGLFASITKGQQVTLKLTISSSSSSPLGTVQGTIQLQSGPTIAKPLPVTVQVWQSVANIAGGYTFLVPNGWLVSTSTSSENFYEPAAQGNFPSLENDVPPAISIRVIANPSGASLNDFANSLDGGWYSGYASRSSLTIDGRNTLLLSDVGITDFREPPLAAFVDLGDRVLLVLGEVDAQREFTEILEGLTFE